MVALTYAPLRLQPSSGHERNPEPVTPTTKRSLAIPSGGRTLLTMVFGASVTLTAELEYVMPSLLTVSANSAGAIAGSVQTTDDEEPYFAGVCTTAARGEASGVSRHVRPAEAANDAPVTVTAPPPSPTTEGLAVDTRGTATYSNRTVD
jgi:hypothetical protein